ncbi:virulence protein [Escherichia coli]|uniref:Virulence protein n=1 Tax=Escherichia coli TaxID=562 RepID=A0A2X3KK29_ECOLX|nr:virulence protein [Escherichia coli]
MLSLFYNKTVIARLTFSVILTQNGHIAFIGGLQGAPKNTDLMLFGAQPGLLWDFSQNGLFLKHFVR